MNAAGPRPATARLRRTTASFLLVVLSGCFREVADPASFEQPYTGTSPLTIRGAAPGQGEETVVALLGPPDRRNDAGYGAASLQWQRLPDMVVTIDTRTRQVTEVLGDRITAAGSTVVGHGMSEADVRAVLGKPATSRGHYRPSGSGVISIGTKRVGRNLTYRRDGHDFEITLNEDSLAYVRLKPAP